MKYFIFSLPIKTALCRLLFHSGLARRKIMRLAKANSLILMYHRVLPRATLGRPIEPGMYVTEESFAQHLSYLVQFFEVLPLSDVIGGHAPRPKNDKGKPHCAITFDDGWLDFLLHAFPVLQRFNAPATVFLPTNFIGTERKFWTDTVAELLQDEQALQQIIAASADNDKLKSNILFQHLSKTDAINSDGVRLDQVISGLKRHPAEDIYRALNALRIAGDSISPTTRSFLDWDEVRLLNDSRLITFGSHTADHNILTTIEWDEVKRELSLSKERLVREKAISAEEPLFFCYPNGNANNKLANMVQDAGYAGAVTTIKGWNAWGANRFLLNRIGLHDDMSSTKAMFSCRLAGFI